jgi:prolyl oligopeptidase
MISKKTVLRIARPTDKLDEITQMYLEGLGFSLLGNFKDHNGFDGSIIGHKKANYHLEFTQHSEALVDKSPSPDNLLVFYFTSSEGWEACCRSMLIAGFKAVSSFNSYWDERGKTFEDIDGYRVVLENRAWSL